MKYKPMQKNINAVHLACGVISLFFKIYGMEADDCSFILSEMKIPK